MKILALDQAGWTGFCWGEPGASDPKRGVYKTPRSSGPMAHAAKMTSLETWLMEVIRQNAIDKVFFEEPFIARGQFANANRSYASERGRWGYPNTIEVACYKTGVIAQPVPISSWRSAFGMPTRPDKTTKAVLQLNTPEKVRKWLKAKARERCLSLGINVEGEDEADAVGIWFAMGREALRSVVAPPLPFEEALCQQQGSVGRLRRSPKRQLSSRKIEPSPISPVSQDALALPFSD